MHFHSTPAAARKAGSVGALTRLTIAAVGAFLLLAVSARADDRTGLDSFQAGRFAEAIQDWQESAAAGDRVSALYLGVVYDTGVGATADYAQALAWYTRAAEAGSVTGMLNAAILYDAGKGMPRDPARAASLYARAAGLGSGRAEYNLAMMREAGDGVPKDRAAAIALYRDAARHGVTAARRHLSQLGISGPAPSHAEAQPRDDGGMEAFDQAQKNLLARDPASVARAADLFREAALRGNALAQYDLGYCYEHGLGLPKDVGEAIRWYRMSAAAPSNPTLRHLAEAGIRNASIMLSHGPR